MGNNKDIGIAINNKLQSLDKSPSDALWMAIEQDLNKKRKRRIAIFFFWTKIMGIMLLVISFGFYTYYNQNENKSSSKKLPNQSISNDTAKIKSIPQSLPNNTIVQSESNIVNNSINQKQHTEINPLKTDRNSILKNESHPFSTSTKRININYSSKIASSIRTKRSKKNNLFSTKTKSSKSKLKTNTKPRINIEKEILNNELTNSNPNNLAELSTAQLNIKSPNLKDTLATTKDTLKTTKEKAITINMHPKDSVKRDSVKLFRKFNVDAFVAPTYYGYFSKTSGLDSKLDSISKTDRIQFSYGIGLSCELTDKISARIGYSRINVSSTFKNAALFTSNYTGIEYNPNISNATIASASNGASKMDIIQKISYTEIPLEIGYQFSKNKIGLSGLMGFSYLVVNENDISIKTNNGYSQYIGKTKGLSPISFSLNIGFECDYALFKNTKIYIKPLLNYQLKAFTDKNNNPFIFGLHTGILFTINNK